MRKKEILDFTEDAQIRSDLLWKVRQSKSLARDWPGNVQFLCLIEVDTFGCWNPYRVCASAYFDCFLSLTSAF